MRALWIILPGLMLGCGGALVSTQAPPSTTAAGHDAEAPGSDAAETAWSRRASLADATTAIDLWTQRATDDPSMFLRVAEARHFFATVHATEAAQVIAHAQAGLAAADQVLNEEAPELLEQLAETGRALDEATAESVPALYWHARLQLVLATAQGYGQLLLADEAVTRALIACERTFPAHDHLGAVVLLAQRDAHPLDVTRRDLASARRRLDRALTAEPDFLPHRVALAEHYAVIARDRALFERELTAVKEASLANPDDAEQRLAKARATTLLERVNELFE